MGHNNIKIVGTPEGEEREQGIENVFEEIMTENTSSGSTESSNQDEPKDAHTKAHYN